MDEDYLQLVKLKCKAEEVRKSLRLDYLNQEGDNHVVKTVRDFPDTFYLPGEPLTPVHLIQHKNHTLDGEPINTRPYRFSPSLKEEVKKVIHKMKTEGAIQNSKSPYNSPLLIMRKQLAAPIHSQAYQKC